MLPAVPPAFAPTSTNEGNSEALDPALAVLGAFFRAVLEHYCGPAWKSIAPREPVVRELIVGHDPEDWDFHEGMLPVLALWREHDGVPTRLDDGNAQQSSLVNVLWICPPADEQKLGARSPFFNAFTKALLLAFKNERDPCWVRHEDEANLTSRTYGSYVWGLAGIDNWSYLGTKRVPVQIANGEGNDAYSGYLATWTILESSETDPAALESVINGERVGVEPTEIAFNLTDRATANPADVLVRQSALIPAEPAEEPEDED